MPDQLAALGISASSREERESQIHQILSEAKPHSKRDGSLTLRWQDPEQLSPKQELVGNVARVTSFCHTLSPIPSSLTGYISK